ncbi:MAG TPA: hypothetical protein VMW17_04530 [Candidatus Binatia bacterium]|nr:hypothetical protein [Candidatus Binatia bacterium]
MRSSGGSTYWMDGLDVWSVDRAPGVPLLGFLSGTVISGGLWAAIGLILFALFA